jgi:hypothetical protein
MKGGTRIIAIVTICIIVITMSFSGCFEEDERNYGTRNNYKPFRGIEIYSGYDPVLVRSSEKISLRALGLNNSSIENVTSDTFILNFTIIELNISKDFHFTKKQNDIYMKFDGFDIDDEKIILNHNYSFQIKYIINSNDSIIQNIKLIGNNNILNGVMRISGSKVNITLFEIYNDTKIENNDSICAILMLPCRQEIAFDIIYRYQK